MLCSAFNRVAAKPLKNAARQHVAVAPSARGSRVLVRANPDPVKTAQDLIAQGAAALKNMDADKVKAAAAQAQAQVGGAVNMSAAAVKQVVDTALGTWSTYDRDGDGKITIAEAVALLNSKEVASAVKQATGMDHTMRTEDEIKKWFARADFDHSGTLSKREFGVMYVGLLADKAKLGAGGLAQALCAMLDSDGDGKIGTSELKGLLAASGLTVLSNVASMIPEGKNVDYRALLGKVK
uniref:EF-hand domain-containing protein n=1 Tax=Tetradesmus obliquus TaxID=3088 RepID=A0A383WGL8_TETOB|eukprot:jgi/Sobl393_1/16985/SZX76403.1